MSDASAGEHESDTKRVPDARLQSAKQFGPNQSGQLDAYPSKSSSRSGAAVRAVQRTCSLFHTKSGRSEVGLPVRTDVLERDEKEGLELEERDRPGWPDYSAQGHGEHHQDTQREQRASLAGGAQVGNVSASSGLSERADLKTVRRQSARLLT